MCSTAVIPVISTMASLFMRPKPPKPPTPPTPQTPPPTPITGPGPSSGGPDEEIQKERRGEEALGQSKYARERTKRKRDSTGIFGAIDPTKQQAPVDVNLGMPERPGGGNIGGI